MNPVFLVLVGLLLLWVVVTGRAAKMVAAALGR